MARVLLILAALLLLATAGLHAAGVAMVGGWTSGLGTEEAAALRLVWLTDSVDWTVVSAIWLIAAWKRERAWAAAAAIAALIPLAGGLGVASIEPGFFGGHMLLASVGLAAAGLLAMRRKT